MRTPDPVPSESVVAQRDALVEQLLQSASGAFTMFSVYLGDRLGFYRALAEGGPLTSNELAARTGTHERYAREWVEQQTVAGILVVEDERADARQRRFRLPPGHAEPLLDRDSLSYVAPLARLIVGCVRPLPALLEAYRGGGGVPYAAYGPDLREGQAAVNRPALLHQLAQEWLPRLPDVHARLQAEPPAAGTGTVMRADTLRRYAAEADFRSVEVLPIDHVFFRFYRLYP